MKMKQLFTLSILTLLIVGCQPKNLPTISDIHSDYAKVKISHLTTKDEMENIKSKLKSVSNIEFDFSQSIFFEDGKIQILKVGVILPDGSRGSGSADLVTLQFKYYGFEYHPKGNPSMRIGTI